MIKRGAFLAAIGLAAAGLLVSGCAQIAPNSADKSEGENPTIVSLNPCTDAILAQLTTPEQLLAISHYSHSPSASSMHARRARQFASTGGSVEEVLALNPDVVVASNFLAPATRAALDQLGIRVEGFGIASTPDDSIAQIRSLAALVGKKQAGEKLVARIEQSLVDGALAHGAEFGIAPSPSASLSAVLWQPGQITAGEEQLVSAMMRNAGFSSHAEAIGLGQADYLSLEQMLANPPDVLIVAGETRGQGHPALSELEDTFHAVLPANMLYCGGPTIPRLAEKLAQIKADAMRQVAK